MSFIWPWVLLSLLALPLCLFVYVRLQRRRGRDAASLGTLGAVREGATKRLGTRKHIPPALILWAVALLALASARPQLTVPLPRMEGTVVLTFDVSASMAADDAEPTRMEAAKAVGKALIERRPSSAAIGVVAFGEGGLVVQPPSDDMQAMAATIDRLAPQSGTSLGRGILTALHLVSSVTGASEDPGMRPGLQNAGATEPRGAFAPAIIVLLTDGENTDSPDPLEVAQMAIDRGVRVYTVGVGTVEGATVEIDGFNVFTQLNEVVLQEIAFLTEGVYFGVDDLEDIRSIYEELETQFVVEPREIEVTSLVGGVSALLLLTGGLLSLFWFGRMP